MNATEQKHTAETVEGVLAELNRLLDAESRTSPDAVERAERFMTSVYLNQVPQIICADGFKLSVQASGGHYCSPRDSVGPWSAVEIGYPSERVEAFMPYIDGDENTSPTDTVYGYVPIKIVATVIAEHGGFAKAEGRS